MEQFVCPHKSPLFTEGRLLAFQIPSEVVRKVQPPSGPQPASHKYAEKKRLMGTTHTKNFRSRKRDGIFSCPISEGRISILQKKRKTKQK